MIIENLNLTFYIWVFNTTMEVNIKKKSIWTTLCYYFEAFDQINKGFGILEHYFDLVYHVCTLLPDRSWVCDEAKMKLGIRWTNFV